MKEVGISGILVVDRERRLLGRVTADDASRLAKENEKSLESIILKDIATVQLDTPINEIFAEEVFPVAVVDEEGTLRGLIIRGALLAALAEGRGTA